MLSAVLFIYNNDYKYKTIISQLLYFEVIQAVHHIYILASLSNQMLTQNSIS